MRRLATWIVIAAGCCAGQSGVAEGLRRGIVAEESRQDLNAAIREYQSVVTQSGVDRATTATALFRMAECYRKLGRKQEADAIYERVAREFADRAELAAQSRSRLKPASEVEAARLRYRETLVQEVEFARLSLQYDQRRYDLGAIHEYEVYPAEMALLAAQEELAAFDSGRMPQTAAPPNSQAETEATRRHHALLREQLELARNNLLMQHQQFDRGVIAKPEMDKAQIEFSRAERRLAAFEAGWAVEKR